MSVMAQYLLKWDSLVLTIVTGSLHKGSVVRLMQWISRSADGQAYAAILAVFASLEADRWRAFSACVYAFAVELAVYKLIKQSIKRPRPFQALAGIVNLIVPPDTFSFPSGHTAGAFVMTVLIGFYHPSLFFPLCLWASFVGLSRIYLCVHYPTDVLAGAGLGIISARAGLFLSECGTIASLL
jgi:undecaprenyl-diphosphatase